MKKIVRLTESDLVRLVNRIIKEDDVAATSAANVNSATANKEQENLFKFLKGIHDMSKYDLGWIPEVVSKNATKFNPQMLGPYQKDYYGGMVLKNNQPMSWALHPLNNTPKAEGVSCHIENENGKLRIYITTGKRNAAHHLGQYGAYLNTPSVVEKSLSNLKEIYDIYRVQPKRY